MTHDDAKVDSEPSVEAPLKAEYLRSAEAITLISAPFGARLTISFLSLSTSPLNNEEPPESMMFLHKSFLKSKSYFEIDDQTVS